MSLFLPHFKAARVVNTGCTTLFIPLLKLRYEILLPCLYNTSKQSIRDVPLYLYPYWSFDMTYYGPNFYNTSKQQGWSIQDVPRYLYPYWSFNMTYYCPVSTILQNSQYGMYHFIYTLTEASIWHIIALFLLCQQEVFPAGPWVVWFTVRNRSLLRQQFPWFKWDLTHEEIFVMLSPLRHDLAPRNPSTASSLSVLTTLTHVHLLALQHPWVK